MRYFIRSEAFRGLTDDLAPVFADASAGKTVSIIVTKQLDVTAQPLLDLGNGGFIVHPCPYWNSPS